MKKYKVIKRFRDKNTKVVFENESVYESDNANRVKELQSLGYLEDEVDKEKKSILDQNVSEVKVAVTSELSKEQLQELLEQEKAGENRKGVKEHIEAILTELDREGE